MTFDRRLFSAAIHARLTQHGLSLREAAKESGISASTLSRLTVGEYTPDIETFSAIVCWLEADANMFLNHIPQSNTDDEAWTALSLSLRDLEVSAEMREALAALIRVVRKK